MDGYEAWMKELDKIVESLVGVSVYELSDALFRDWYEDGIDPEIAAKWAIEEA